MKVQKRSGVLEEFDSAKIARAIEAAFDDLDSPFDVDYVVSKVSRSLHDDVVTVEQIEEIVELMLMEEGLHRTARAYIAYRATHSAAPDDSILADYIVASKYAREGETWDDVINRYCDAFGVDRGGFAAEMMRERKILPSMRALQFAPSDKDARYYNCSYGVPDSADQIAQIFWLLLCGCGVGYSVQKHHVARLPVVVGPDLSKNAETYQVLDSIEGWRDAVRHLLYSYFSEDDSAVEFDYSQIRPRGAPISSIRGRAPGYVPLKTAIENVRRVLDGAIGRRLKPIEVHDIICFLAEGVLAGGVRRSSLIALFSHDDNEMLNAKTGDWCEKNPQRAMANNSVHLAEDGPAESDVEAGWPSYYMDTMREFGEPGIFLAKSSEYGTNPCGEIGLSPKGGFHFCNLTEINVADIETHAEFFERCHWAAYLGCLQARKTDVPGSQHNLMDQPLLGVSLTGIMDNLNFMMNAGMLAQGVKHIWDVCEQMGVDAHRVTTIKPSGTASLVLGNVSAGIHPHHSKRYIRRVTASETEPVFLEFREKNPDLCVRKPNGDWVIEFPCETSGRTLDDVGALGHLQVIRFFYENWIRPGSKHPPNHNVSATVVVRDHEWDDVKEWVDANVDSGGLSFLPYHGDKTYAFAPREAVRSKTELAKWRALCKAMVPVEYTGGVSDFGAACEGPSCEL